MINLSKVLDDYYRKYLKVYGVSFHSKMNEEDMEEFYKELFLVGLPMNIVHEIIEQIDEYVKNGDSTNYNK